MKKNIIKILSILFSLLLVIDAEAAVVIKKEDAYQYSRASDYAREIDSGEVSGGSLLGSGGGTGDDEISTKFVCTTAKKDGDTYTNTWSNYTITFDEGRQIKKAVEFYDFNNDDCKYDFGLYWPDYSRLAVYYTRLSRDIDTVAKSFAPTGSPRNAMIAGEVYRYIQEAVDYPYGVEYYDYYLRNVDGKLMVIECFHENDDDIAPTYIEQFERYN